MAIDKKEPKPEKRKITIEEEIAAQREKLKKLEERQRENIRKERERNGKAVMDMIRGEKLDLISAELWKEAMPTIKKALKMD